jgi:hypothetical protein
MADEETAPRTNAPQSIAMTPLPGVRQPEKRGFGRKPSQNPDTCETGGDQGGTATGATL